MILNSILNGPLIWPTIVEENGTTRTKKYEELSVAEKLQVDFDLKATNIVLQGLPPDVYAIANHHKVPKDIWDRVKLLMQGTKLSLQEKECLAAPVFTQRDDPITYLNKAMAFLSAIAALRPRNAAWFKDKAMLAKAQESGQILDEEQLAFLADSGILNGQAAQTTIPNTAAFQTEDLDAYNSDCDDVSTTQAVLMANLSNSDFISEVPHSEPYHHDMDNQSMHAMRDFKQTPIIDFIDNEKTSDSNIILYSLYLQEMQQEAV
ncbi:hypothetical protein Tco_0608097 [Tanacetum coccineum]